MLAACKNSKHFSAYNGSTFRKFAQQFILTFHNKKPCPETASTVFACQMQMRQHAYAPMWTAPGFNLRDIEFRVRSSLSA